MKPITFLCSQLIERNGEKKSMQTPKLISYSLQSVHTSIPSTQISQIRAGGWTNGAQALGRPDTMRTDLFGVWAAHGCVCCGVQRGHSLAGRMSACKPLPWWSQEKEEHLQTVVVMSECCWCLCGCQGDLCSQMCVMCVCVYRQGTGEVPWHQTFTRCGFLCHLLWAEAPLMGFLQFPSL